MSAGGVGPAGPPPIPPELSGAPPTEGPRVPAAGSFWADWLSLLRNRFILGGLGLLVVLLLTMVVLVLLGSGDDATGGPAVQANTPAHTPTAVPPGTVIGRMRTTASARSGPDVRYTPLGTIRTGVVLSIVGRSEDDAWLQVIYPPGSTLHGWVDRTLLEVTGNISLLRVAGPELGPVVEVPTSPFFNPTFQPFPTTEDATPTGEFPFVTSTPRPTRTRAPTATPIRIRSVTATPEDAAGGT